MKRAVKQASVSILVMQRNMFLFLSCALLFAVLSLSIVACRKETLTLFKTPETRIDLKTVEKEAHYLAHLILNRSSTSHKSQNEALFEWVDPSSAISLHSKLEAFRREMTESKKSYEWELLDSSVELEAPDTVKVYLSGNVHVLIPTHEETKQVVQKEHGHYLMIFQLKNGKLLLNSFNKEKRHA